MALKVAMSETGIKDDGHYRAIVISHNMNHCL